MKRVNSMFICLTLMLISVFAYGQGAEKTLVKSFNLEGSQLVQLDVAGDVEVKEWSNNYARVLINIKIENGSEAMLKSLVRNGRYNLYSSNKEDAFHVVAPAMNRKVTVGGENLQELVSYTFFLPENVAFQQKKADGDSFATSK
jgi:hypothetical protein